MITNITHLTQLPEIFRLFSGTLEQATKLYPTAIIYHFVGSPTRYGCWEIIALQETTNDSTMA
jgi:hypothetical protein